MNATLTIRIDDALERELKQYAAATHRPKGDNVREALPPIGVGAPPRRARGSDAAGREKRFSGRRGGVQGDFMRVLLDTNALSAHWQHEDFTQSFTKGYWLSLRSNNR